MAMLIYCHTNTVTGKRYVGQTKLTLEMRWRGHCKDAKKSGRKSIFHNAILSYGENAWTHEILEDDLTSQELTNDRERYWISHFQTCDREFGYNCTQGGDKVIFTPDILEKIGQTSRGRKHTLDSRRAISEACKKTWREKIANGYRLTDEQRQKHNEACALQRGKVHQRMKQSTRDKISAAQKGIKEITPVSEETRRKLSDSLHARWTPEARKDLSKKMQKVTDDQVMTARSKYDSGIPLDILANELNISVTQMMRRLRKIMGTPLTGWNWSST